MMHEFSEKVCREPETVSEMMWRKLDDLPPGQEESDSVKERSVFVDFVGEGTEQVACLQNGLHGLVDIAIEDDGGVCGFLTRFALHGRKSLTPYNPSSAAPLPYP